jgi:hypothetical protein
MKFANDAYRFSMRTAADDPRQPGRESWPCATSRREICHATDRFVGSVLSRSRGCF